MTIAVYYHPVNELRHPAFYCSVKTDDQSHRIVKATHTYRYLNQSERQRYEGLYLGDFINYVNIAEYNHYYSKKTRILRLVKVLKSKLLSLLIKLNIAIVIRELRNVFPYLFNALAYLFNQILTWFIIFINQVKNPMIDFINRLITSTQLLCKRNPTGTLLKTSHNNEENLTHSQIKKKKHKQKQKNKKKKKN